MLTLAERIERLHAERRWCARCGQRLAARCFRVIPGMWPVERYGICIPCQDEVRKKKCSK